MPSPFPPALLVDGRRLPGNADTFRRLVRAVDLQPGERVLLLGAAEGAALKILAREHGAQVTALEWEPAFFTRAEARVRDENLGGRVTLKADPLTALPKASFEVVLVETLPPPGPLAPFAAALRELLVTNGRLGLTLPAAVGLATAAPVSEHWSKILGAPLLRPAALLGQLEVGGFEPQWAEALSEEVMAEHHRLAEARLPTAEGDLAQALKQGLELWKSGVGRTGSSFVMLTGRRREPNEKPPPARSGG